MDGSAGSPQHAGLEAAEDQDVLDTAESMEGVATREIKKVPTLRGKTVGEPFYEASTRTAPLRDRRRQVASAT